MRQQHLLTYFTTLALAGCGASTESSQPVADAGVSSDAPLKPDSSVNVQDAETPDTANETEVPEAGDAASDLCSTDKDCSVYDDGNLCNGTMKCQAGKCLADPTVVTCPSQPPGGCLESVCVPSSGQCTEKSKANGSWCDDGKYCTEGDACHAGVCAGSAKPCSASCEVCDESLKSCTVAKGSCLIYGSCFAAQKANSANECQLCMPEHPTEWSPSSPVTPCNDYNSCTVKDTCDGTGHCTG